METEMTEVIKHETSLSRLYAEGLENLTIAEKIALVVSRVNAGGGQLPFIYEDVSRLNARLDGYRKEEEKGDKPGFPVAFMLVYPTGTFRQTRGVVPDCPAVKVGFITDAPLDFCGLPNERRVHRMKQLARRFLDEYEASGMFAPLVWPVSYEVLVDAFDCNATGVMLSFVAAERSGPCSGTIPWDWTDETTISVDIQHTEGTPCGC